MNNSHRIYKLFSLTLFLIFVIGGFFIVTYEMKGYQSIYDASVLQDDLSTPLAYLNTKFKSNDRKDSIEIKTIHQRTCLCIKTLETMTYIYFQDGYIYENYTTVDYVPSFQEGTKLFKVDNFSMKYDKGLYTFEVEKQGLKKNIALYLHSEEGRYE